VLIAALNALALEAITRPASNMLNAILEAIPSIFAATSSDCSAQAWLYSIKPRLTA